VRWTLWCTAAWAFYYFARLPVSLARFPEPPGLPPDAVSAHVSFLLVGIAIFAISIVVFSAAIATLLAVPYAFVVARHPERRFWGERAPFGRVMLGLAAVFIPLGLVLGAFQPQTHVELRAGAPMTTPHPVPPRGR